MSCYTICPVTQYVLLHNMSCYTICPVTQYVLLHNTRNVYLLWFCLKVDHSFIFRARKKKVKGNLLKGNNLEAFKLASLKPKQISYKTIHHFANLWSLFFYTVSFYQQKLLSNVKQLDVVSRSLFRVSAGGQAVVTPHVHVLARSLVANVAIEECSRN